MDEPETKATRPRGRPRGPAKGPTARPAPGRRKRSLILSDAAWMRLTVQATASGRDRSQVVEALVLEHCRRYVVHDRDRPRGESAEPAAA